MRNRFGGESVTGMVRELLSDGSPRSIADVFQAIMDRIPNSAAARRYEARLKKERDLSEKVMHGKRILVTDAVFRMISQKELSATGGKGFEKVVQKVPNA